MSWQFSCSRVYLALQEFTQSTLEGIRRRALALLNDLRSSRATLQCLGRVEAIDCVCQETTRASSVITPLHEDAARRVTEQLRRRVQNYRTTIAEEYRMLVPTTREAFEKAFDSFVDLCLQSSRSRTDHWFLELVSSGAVQDDLWFVYITFQRQLREACLALSKSPLPPPLFRLESLPSSDHPAAHRRSQTEPRISGSSREGETMMRSHSLDRTDRSSKQSDQLCVQNSDEKRRLDQIQSPLRSPNTTQTTRTRLESVASFHAPQRTTLCDIQMLPTQASSTELSQDKSSLRSEVKESQRLSHVKTKSAALVSKVSKNK